MKKSSVVLLIIAGILILTGIGLCVYASFLSKQENIPLYDTTVELREKDGARIYDFTDQDVSRLKIDLNGVDVHITASETEKSYVELLNFTSGTFDVSASNRLLSITNQSQFSALYDTENGGLLQGNFQPANFIFKGLRYFLRFSVPKAGESRKVNIYLAQNAPVKIISLQDKDGNLTVSDVSLSCDYDIENENGTVAFENMSTASAVNLQVQSGDVRFSSSALSVCRAELTDGTLKGEALRLGVLSAHISRGEAQIALAAKLDGYRYFLQAPKGTVTTDDTETGKRAGKDEGFGYFQVVADTGNIQVTSGEILCSDLGIQIDEKIVEKELLKRDDSLKASEYE